MKKLPKEALEFFRKSGSKGGKKRNANMSDDRKSEIGKKAAAARWANKTAK